MQTSFDSIRTLPSHAARAAIRRGDYARHTAGLALGCLQANLVILPQEHAADFEAFCLRNPRPCPIVGKTAPGDPVFHTLGADVDIRTDAPSYNIYREGALAEQTADISAHWQADMVGFALGCSFTFENALLRAGIPMWHIANDTTVPMYRTTLPLEPVGPFRGQMVVSMRMIPEADVERAVDLSGQYPWAHGAPVHTGDPAAIGIPDLSAPDWGDPTPVLAGHVPCFWACGVTPQSVVIGARLPFVITHTPGHMLITDIPETEDTRNL